MFLNFLCPHFLGEDKYFFLTANVLFITARKGNQKLQYIPSISPPLTVPNLVLATPPQNIENRLIKLKTLREIGQTEKQWQEFYLGFNQKGKRKWKYEQNNFLMDHHNSVARIIMYSNVKAFSSLLESFISTPNLKCDRLTNGQMD